MRGAMNLWMRSASAEVLNAARSALLSAGVESAVTTVVLVACADAVPASGAVELPPLPPPQALRTAAIRTARW